MRSLSTVVVASLALAAAGCEVYRAGGAGGAGTARRATGPLTRGQMAGALTGVWDGTSHYPARDLAGKPVQKPPVLFRLTVQCKGTTFTGTWGETVAGKGERRAAVKGNVRPDGRVLFVKTYEGEASAGIVYQGRLEAAPLAVRGTWTLPGNWSGAFEMRKLPEAAE